MALVVATPLLSLASARSLERLGIAQKALQALPLAQRLEGLRAATGRLITPIRKRYGTPLVPTLDLTTVDTSKLTGGATVDWDGGPASKVTDYLVKFTVTNGVTTYQVDPHGGAYRGANDGQQFGAALPFSGPITFDGYVLTINGMVVNGDVIGFSTTIVQDPGIALAVAQVAAFILLHNRGIDPASDQDLRIAYDGAMAWAAALGEPGEGELDRTVDRTPNVSEYGPLTTGDSSPYAWLDQP